jgi:carboxybiotin decarboxylase
MLAKGKPRRAKPVLDQVIAVFNALLAKTGAAQFSLGNFVMIAAGAGMIWAAAVRRVEPLLLAGAGFACIVVNVPGANEGALFHYAALGMGNLIIPSLLALGIGAMTDFGPVIANPRLVILGAGAQLGIVAALVLASALGFTLKEAGAIGLIGAADGPMAIFVTAQLAPHLLGPVSVATFAFLALMPMMLERTMPLPPAKDAARAGTPRTVTKLEKIGFPLCIAIAFNLFFPPIAPLIAMFMLGNLLREVGGAGRLARTASGIMNALIVILAVAVGSTMTADAFLTVQTGKIALLGLLALAFGVVSTLGIAKLMNMVVDTPVDPLAPIARTSYGAGGQQQARMNSIHHAIGMNSAGVFGAAVLSGILLVALGGK